MNKKASEDLAHIKNMMERSSRFISLSGLSGIEAGVVGVLTGGVILYLTHNKVQFVTKNSFAQTLDKSLISQIILIGLVALALALCMGSFFTIRKSKKLGLQIWTSTSKKLLVQLVIPLLIGGVFVLTRSALLNEINF